MLVEIGNASALDAREEEGRKVYFAVSGERTTTVRVPDGIGMSEAFASIVDALQYHIQPGCKPVWVQSDHAGLQTLLLNHFGINPADNIRPIEWGKES